MDALPTPKRQALQAANFSLFSPLTTTTDKSANIKDGVRKFKLIETINKNRKGSDSDFEIQYSHKKKKVHPAKYKCENDILQMDIPITPESNNGLKNSKRKKSKSQDIDISTPELDEVMGSTKKHKKKKSKNKDSNDEVRTDADTSFPHMQQITVNGSSIEKRVKHKKSKKKKLREDVDLGVDNDILSADAPSPGSPATPQLGSPVTSPPHSTSTTPTNPSLQQQPRYEVAGYSECSYNAGGLCAEDVQGKQLYLISMPKDFDATVLDGKCVVMNSAIRVGQDKEQGGHWELQSTSCEPNICGGNITVLLPSKTDQSRLKSVGHVSAHLNVVKTIPVSPYLVPEVTRTPPQIPDGLKCRNQPFGSNTPTTCQSNMKSDAELGDTKHKRKKDKKSKHRPIMTEAGEDKSTLPPKKKHKSIKVEPT